MAERTLCIVGGGPKAAAIAARAAVLRSPERGLDVPEIVVLEQDHVGAAWSGRGGYSSGFLTLCSPPEKDVGFPYVEAKPGYWGAPVANEVFRRFSWSAFLVGQGRFAEWVDRGREFPSHSDWADYLAWVFKTAEQAVTEGRVTSVEPTADGRWRVTHVRGKRTGAVIADGVVLTGTGRSRRVEVSDAVPVDRLFDAESFWKARQRFLKLKNATVAVIGDGGAAGTIVAWLASSLAEETVSILSVNPLGTLLPRGDGYSERRWFSDPSDWQSLSIDDRRTLMARTEAGVVSLRLKSIIDAATNVNYHRGRATKVEWDMGELDIEMSYDGKSKGSLRADYLVQAIGFEAWSLLDVVQHPGMASFLGQAGQDKRAEVELSMESDLSLPPGAGLGTGLHVPGLATLSQGPGMATLGCLGLLAGAVLDPYVEKPPQARQSA